MTFENAKWTDAARSAIEVTADGIIMTVPVDPKNSHYVRLMASGVEIADPD